MKKYLVTIAAIAATILCGSVAGADNKAGSFAVTPFIGGYTFDGVQEIDSSFIFGLRAGYNITKAIGVEAVVDYGKTDKEHADIDASILNYRLEALYNFFPDNRFVPFLAVGYGGTRLKVSGINAMNAGAFDYGLGAKYSITDNLALRADLRHIIIDSGPTVNNYEYTLGLAFSFGGNKAPVPPAPTTSLTVSPASVVKGQPATLSWTSQNANRCDIQPDIGAVQTSGSQSVTPTDSTDYSLTCKGDGGSSSSSARLEVTQPAKEEPLPVAAAEPTPEIYKYCITLHTEFDVDKSVIRPQYHDEIAKVGDFMNKYPSTTAVIEGHTDNVGGVDHNLKLSQQRAESVVNYLVDTFGIARSRLTATGFGSSRPIADNSTNAGKQTNRRIEAIIDCAFDVTKVTPPDRLCMGLNMEFDSGKADIKPQYHDEIARVGTFMKQNPTTTAIIEGHTDNVGDAESNMKLSKKRAENVVAYLVNNFGIESSRLEAKGYGQTRRIAYNSTPEGRQKNRRINAIIDCVIKK